MTTIDARYDPAAHHDLDRVESAPLTPSAGAPVRWVAVCACGWAATPSRATRDLAFTDWDNHRQKEWFG